jgi:hypothetical protein
VSHFQIEPYLNLYDWLPSWPTWEPMFHPSSLTGWLAVSVIPKTGSHRGYPCFHKSSINITFYPTNARFFPSTQSRRRRIIVFFILQMMNNKPIIPRTVCMQFAQLGSVSRDCHSKLHHLCDVKCSKNALQFYLRWLGLHFGTSQTLPAARPCWYTLLSRTDNRPTTCQHFQIAVEKDVEVIFQSCSHIFTLF